MLSRTKDNVIISHWLREWLCTGVIFPKIVVTNQSLALMMAIVKLFTKYSKRVTYISTFFALLHGKNVEVASCIMKNNMNHVMHLIST